MKEFRKHILTLFSILFFVLAVIQENQTLKNEPELKLIQAFQQNLLEQESELFNYLNDAEEKLADTFTSGNYATTFSNLNHLFEDKGLGFIIFRDQTMVYWSNNRFTFPNLLSKL